MNGGHTHPYRKVRLWGHRALISAAALAALALMGEVLLRAPRRPLQPPQERIIKRQQDASHQARIEDPYLGARHVPFSHYTQHTPDFDYLVETDSLGFPNRGAWPSNVDVVVLGNSLVVGRGVGIDAQFTSLLANRFAKLTFLNLGLAGASPEQQYRVYLKYARALDPHWVVACLWVASDIENALHFAGWLREGSQQDFDEFRKNYVAMQSGYTRFEQVRNSVLGRSHLLRTLYYSAQALSPARKAFTDSVEFSGGGAVYLSVRLQRRLAVGMDRVDDPNLREDLIAPLQRLESEASARGSRFLVVLIPSKEEIYGASTFPDVLKTIEQVRAELTTAELPVLDLYDFIRENSRQAPAFFPADIHLNRYGNELVARALGDRLEAEGILQPRLSTATEEPGESREPALQVLDKSQ